MKKPAPLSPPASRLDRVRDRRKNLERQLTALRAMVPAAAIACMEGKPRALATLERKIRLAAFELASFEATEILVGRLDQDALDAWRAAVQALPPERIIEGLTKDECCARCSPGDCVIGGADALRSECMHPIKAGDLYLLKHKGNPKIVAAYSAAVARVGTRKEARR